jgi:glycosyltransferase involved in cell wall biosynthesis
MKALVLTRSYDHTLGGMEEHTRLLVESLVRAGWQVVVGTPDIRGAAHFVINQAEVRRLGPQPPVLTKYSLGFWWRVRKLVISEGGNFDVIINISMAMAGCAMVPPALWRRTVAIAHGTYTLERQTLVTQWRSGEHSPKIALGIPYTFIFDRLQKRICQQAAAIICVSAAVRANLVRRYGITPEKCVAISNSVNVGSFDGVGSRQSSLISILFLSRLHQEKGLLVLLRAFKKLLASLDVGQRVVLTVAGDGPAASVARAEVAALKLGEVVNFLGAVDHRRVPSVMADHDIFCFPTLRQEGQPISLLEAMASGLAIVASNVEGPREILADQRTALMVAPGRPDDLAQALRRLVVDRNLARQLGLNAREEARANYDANVQFARIEKLLTDIAQINNKKEQI